MTNKEFNETSVLIVDDNQDVLDSMEMFLKHEFSQIHLLSDPQQIIPFLQKNLIDVIVLDMNFQPGAQTGKEGLFWLSEILKSFPEAIVIMLTAYGDVNLAVQAIKNGATDFILKPWDNDKLVSTLKAGIKLSKSQRELKHLQEHQKQIARDDRSESEIIWGNSHAMRELRKVVEKVANTDTNILIFGENGTGKELIAKELHALSSRRDNPFVKVDMGTLNENMFESEMFGHEKGAFTDAKEKRIGRFEIANKGSIFLDEIANLPVYLQAKLLSSIQNRIITRVGSNDPIDFDVRIISATNKNLEKMVKDNLFRQDLFYRLKTIHLEIPPLRERGEDVIILAHHFLEKYKKRYDKHPLNIDEEAENKLREHSWPGNVRELMHTIEKAVILNESGIIKSHDFLLKESPRPDMLENIKNLDLNNLERMAIETAIKKNNFNMSKTAKELGVSRPTLYTKIKQYNIEI
jgi:DNA-binding NtrC family response regulator